MGVERADILQVKNLSVARGDNVLFSNLDFSIQSGDVIWVVGTNGIGKTSLLKSIAGLLRPESGEVLWRGENALKNTDGQIGFAGHNDTHKPNLSVEETMRFWQKIYNSNSDIKQILAKIGLENKAGLRTKSLSAGQSRRLALGRIILQNAKLWILDEPMASMDKSGRDLIENLVEKHCKAGGLALIASHSTPKKISSNTRILSFESELNASN